MVKEWVLEKLRKMRKESGITLKDEIEPQGELRIIVLDKDKKIIDVVEGNNLVVVQGRHTLARLLGCRSDLTANVQDLYGVSYLQVGVDDTAPLITDTALKSPIPQFYEVEVYFPSDGRSVEFIAEIGIGQPTGVNFPVVLKEAGLFTGKTTKLLFSRRVYPAITKTYEMTIIYDWIIKF